MMQQPDRDRIRRVRESFKDNPLVLHYIDEYANNPGEMFNSVRLFASEEKFNMHPQRRKTLRSINRERDQEYISYCFRKIKEDHLDEVGFRGLVNCDASTSFPAIEKLGYKLVLLQPSHKTEWGRYYARTSRTWLAASAGSGST